MKYFFIVGERSGDLHAASVISQLKSLDPQAVILAWGGSAMQKAGANILKDYRHFSVIGFSEVLKRLNTLRQYLKACKEDIKEADPDVVVLVDFAGFNLRIARYVHSRGIKTVYFIPPKVWAWNPSRIKLIKRTIDCVLTILPFEEALYRKHGCDVKYVGTPVLEELNDHPFDDKLIRKLNSRSKKIVFLPGSRVREIESAIPVIQKLTEVYEDYEFLISGVDNVDESLYEPLRDIRNLKIYFAKTYELLKAADAAIVTSGTATLEAALLGAPQVVVYKTSWLTYTMARSLARVKFISLVNIIAGRRIVKELIQADYNAVDLAAELESILHDAETKKRISEGYSEIRNKLGTLPASTNAAKAIYELCR